MPVTTRYQRNAALYSNVLENPLILNNIFRHLEAKDTLNLLITNAPFTEEERFQDTLNRFLKKKKSAYDSVKSEIKYHEFIDHVIALITTFETIKNTGGSIHQQESQLRRMYDHINDNKWFLMKYPVFSNEVEKKLVKYLDSPSFHLDALHYLGEIFGIFVKIEPYVDGYEEYFLEYIITRNGEKVYF